VSPGIDENIELAEDVDVGDGEVGFKRGEITVEIFFSEVGATAHGGTCYVEAHLCGHRIAEETSASSLPKGREPRVCLPCLGV